MEVTQRFLKYVSFDTTSSEMSDTVPTTDHQKVLGRYLAQELAELGLEGAHMDDNGYVYALLPATPGCQAPALGLIAHMDTSPAVSGADIHPEIVTYQGGDLPLKKAGSLKVKDFPFLERYIGQELIVTDGTTLLGADDKAGVAEIVTACEYLLAHPEVPHRAIAVCFTPDEEVGKGADHFDPEKFPARVAYTVDGGELGEIEYENFNAAAVTLTVEGVNIHPGSAKNKMKNAILLANQFISLLPAAEAPAHTEGYEGFYHVTDLAGNESQVVLLSNGQPVAALYALTGDNREKRALMGSRMALKRQNGVTYAGELLAGANYCGLDEESLRLGFNLVMAEWAA